MMSKWRRNIERNAGLNEPTPRMTGDQRFRSFRIVYLRQQIQPLQSKANEGTITDKELKKLEGLRKEIEELQDK